MFLTPRLYRINTNMVTQGCYNDLMQHVHWHDSCWTYPAMNSELLRAMTVTCKGPSDREDPRRHGSCTSALRVSSSIRNCQFSAWSHLFGIVRRRLHEAATTRLPRWPLFREIWVHKSDDDDTGGQPRHDCPFVVFVRFVLVSGVVVYLCVTSGQSWSMKVDEDVCNGILAVPR